MNQHINIEDYLEPTDPPLPLPAIETFKGTNTLDSTIEIGETMITQGYRIPLQIKQGAIAKTADIYIGNAPLTQGQTITKSQSNVDLELFSGDNTIDTTLVNKPDASITYNSSVLGVGERTITSFTDWESGTTTTGVAQVGKTYAECKNNTSPTTRRRSVSIISVVSGAATLHITSGYQAADIHFDKDGLYIGNNVSYHSNNYQISISDTVKYVALVLKKSDNSEFTDDDVWDAYFTYSGVNAYKIPLLITSGQQSTPHTIYIGDSPLTEGQSISKTSTGTEIALYQGENTISTTLGNKPEMKIDYLSTVVGVGERTENLINVAGFTMPANTTRTAATKTIWQGTLETGIYTIAVYQKTVLTSNERNTLRANLTNGSVYESTASNYHLSEGWHTLSFTVDTAQTVGLYLWAQRLSSDCEYNKIMLVKGSTAPTEYIPYGYQLPIDIIQGDEVVDHKDIYIGAQPLVEGASISKASAKENIALVSGNNQIDTDLFNKPEMYIK